MGSLHNARTVERLSDSVRSLVDESAATSARSTNLRREGPDAAPALHQDLCRHRRLAALADQRINAAQPWSEALRRLEPSTLELLARSRRCSRRSASDPGSEGDQQADVDRRSEGAPRKREMTEANLRLVISIARSTPTAGCSSST